MTKLIYSAFSFMAGMFVGAVFALLYAPMAGVELRAEIRQQAEEQWVIAMEQWENAMVQMQQAIARMEETTEDMKAQMEEKEKAA